MTDKVDPTPSGDGQAYMVAQAIEQFGTVGSGWIAKSSNAYAAGHPNSGISGSPLNAFAKTGESGLDVTFDTGEAFIGGSWVARDTQTTISLADNTTGQAVKLGWDYNGTDTVKIGVPGASPGDSFYSLDPRIDLYEFDTSSGSVTSETDQRPLGKSATLGASTLDAGTEIARFLMTAVSGSQQGTAGDASGELWRAGSSTSDLLMTVRGAGTNRMNLCWNAYYDGSDWRFITGSENAFRIVFDDTALELLAADGSSASADDVISSWDGLRVDNGGDVWDADGHLLYDESADEFQKGRLGGPAGSLSSYPIPASDIADGSGSGLNADQVDGKDAGDLQGGQWTSIDSTEDTDTSTVLDWDTGTLSTVYDLYKVQFVYQHQGSNFNELRMRVNGISTSTYDTLYIGQSSDVSTQENESQWMDIAKVWDGHGVGHGSVIVRGGNLSASPSGNAEPSMSVQGFGKRGTNQAVGGSQDGDNPTVDQLRIFTEDNATGKAKLLGMTL